MTDARISQLPIEIAISPTDQQGRNSQLPVEAAVLPTDQQGRLSQVPVEAAILPTDQQGRLSHLVVEVALTSTPQSYGQAQALIHRYEGYGQAQGYVKTTPSAFGQAQTLIHRYEGYSQAQATLKGIAFDTASHSTTSSWTHTPVGIPRGVILIATGPNNGGTAASVTYGGVALTLIRHDDSLTGAQSHSEIWFLGSNIPSGPQTVSIGSNGSSEFTLISLTSANNRDTVLVDSDGGGGSGLTMSALLSYQNKLSLAVVAGAQHNLPAFPLTGETELFSGGHFNGSYWHGYQTHAHQADFTAGLTQTATANNDYAFTVAAFTEAELSYRIVNAQAQAKINAFNVPQTGQALAYIGHFQPGLAQAHIKSKPNALGQALAYIGHFQTGLAQARLIAFDVEGFGQAAAQIAKSAGYGNAQATLKSIVSSRGQAQAWILPTTNRGQAQAWIKQTYPLLSIDTNYALVSMGAIASDSLEQTIEPYYAIDNDDYGFRWTIAGIALDQYLAIDLGQIRTINYFRILPMTYDTTVSIQYSDDNVNWSTAINGIQFSVDFFGDVDTSRVVTGEIGPISARYWRLLVTDDGSNNGISIATFELGIATVKSPTFAQAQAFLGHFGVAQAQAYVSPGFGITHGQAKSQIMETFTRRGQANAFVIKPQVYGQSQGTILQTYYAFGQVPSWVIPPTVIANAQATIKAYDVEGLGQALADIEQTYNRVANAKAMIHKLGGWAQAQALIKSSRLWARGQARAKIGNIHTAHAMAWIIKGQGYGQAKAQIKQFFMKHAQAAAQIRQLKGYSQAQAQIKQTYSVYGLAVAIMNQTFALGQAQANIEQTYSVHGQANARLKNIATNYSKPYGLAQGSIEYVYPAHGQSQAWLNVRYRAVGNAQAFIGPIQTGQAQARILSFDYVRLGQALAYIAVSVVTSPPSGPVPRAPSSDYHSYLVRYNGHDLPGYAQEESYNSVMRISQHYAKSIDGSLSQYYGLVNKEIVLRMRTWELTYPLVKERVQEAANMLRSLKGSFAKLYIHQPDAYFLAMVRRIETAKDAFESRQTLDYRVTFEAKPWLISNDVYEISGTGLISTTARTIYDGGWTPTKILVSGTDVTITAYTATGDPAGSLTIEGECNNLIIDSENFTATENGINRNDIVLNKNYVIYVGPGETFFQINGATSCVIQYQNRWYLSSTRRASVQPIATTPMPTTIVTRGTGQVRAAITSGIKQGFGQARSVIRGASNKSAQTQALIHSPITNAHGQARAILRNGRSWATAQSQARTRVINNAGVGQTRAVIEGPTKFKNAQALATIRQHKKVASGQARAKVQTLPPTPSGLTTVAGDGQVTLTWA